MSMTVHNEPQSTQIGRIWTPGMMSSIRQDWGTPDQLFYFLNQEFKFSLDVCAANATVSKCARYFSPKDDSLSSRCVWRFACWMNPPYGREIDRWIRKAYES